MATPERRVVLGRLGAPHGVNGWLRVDSYTDPRDNVLRYSPWQIGRSGRWQSWRVLNSRTTSRGPLVLLAGEMEMEPLADRDQAALLSGSEIAVSRDQLPPAPAGEYYWVDLIGVQVETLKGIRLGVVERVFSTAANDVLVISGEREHLVPFVRNHVVHEVDLDAGFIRVDWDPDF